MASSSQNAATWTRREDPKSRYYPEDQEGGFHEEDPHPNICGASGYCIQAKLLRKPNPALIGPDKKANVLHPDAVAVVTVSPKAISNWRDIEVSMFAATWTKTTGDWELIAQLRGPQVASGLEGDRYPDTLLFVFGGLDFEEEAEYDLRVRVAFRGYQDPASNEASFPPEELWRRGTFPSTPERQSKYEEFVAGGLCVYHETKVNSSLKFENAQTQSVMKLPHSDLKPILKVPLSSITS
ncbi:hypothetical protein B0T09DRAFT_390359 [Sordaria sp. MPI-SDFR-AT-0083]|nr:hypothetical protein B0T09DRAFT_390359 [Sordaria sp. MPI-SDFR-AT-0083]